MISKDAILDRIDECEDQHDDLVAAGEYAAAYAVQQTLADLYRALEYAH